MLILGSDSPLNCAVDALVSVMLSPFSFLVSGKEETDLINLFSAEWLPAFNLLGFEAFESLLCKGGDDPGSESLNFYPL